MVSLHTLPETMMAVSTVVRMTPQEEDEALVARGLDAIFERYAPYVASIGYKLLGHHDEIDDLIQDVFLDAHRHLHKLRDPGAVRAWLGTITVNQVRRRLRKRRIKHFFGLDPGEVCDHVPHVEANAEQRLLLRRIFEIMDRKLSADEQLAWTLQRIEGENLERIAELMGCSTRTVKRRVARAQELIHKELERP